jgi:hypothetical protein
MSGTMTVSSIILCLLLLTFTKESLFQIPTFESAPFGNFVTGNEMEIASSWEFLWRNFTEHAQNFWEILVPLRMSLVGILIPFMVRYLVYYILGRSWHRREEAKNEFSQLRQSMQDGKTLMLELREEFLRMQNMERERRRHLWSEMCSIKEMVKAEEEQCAQLGNEMWSLLMMMKAEEISRAHALSETNTKKKAMTGSCLMTAEQKSGEPALMAGPVKIGACRKNDTSSLQAHRQKNGERAHQRGLGEFGTTSRSQSNEDGFNEGDEGIIFDDCGTDDWRSCIDGATCQDWDIQEKRNFSLQDHRQKKGERAHRRGLGEFGTTSGSHSNRHGFNEGDEGIIFDDCGTDDRRSCIDGGPWQNWDMQEKRHFSLQVHKQNKRERAHQLGQDEFDTTCRSESNGDGFNEGDEGIIFDDCGTDAWRSCIDGATCQEWDMQEKRNFILQVHRQ